MAKQKFSLLLLKFRVILMVLTLLNPTHQCLGSEGYIKKTTFLIKIMLVSNYNIQYQIMDVSIISTPTRKKFIKHSLHCLLLFIFASLCLHYKTPGLVSQHIWTPLLFHHTSFQSENYPDGNFHHVHRRWLSHFQEKC